MPTYDYECRSCGNRIEIIHSMREDGPTACELCGGALRRVLYPAGIIFKGSGFYSTDSRSSSSNSTETSSKPAPNAEASTDGSKEPAAGGDANNAAASGKGTKAAGGESTSKAAGKAESSGGASGSA